MLPAFGKACSFLRFQVCPRRGGVGGSSADAIARYKLAGRTKSSMFCFSNQGHKNYLTQQIRGRGDCKATFVKQRGAGAYFGLFYHEMTILGGPFCRFEKNFYVRSRIYCMFWRLPLKIELIVLIRTISNHYR